MCACHVAWNKLGDHAIYIQPVVQGFDPLGRPTQMLSDFIAHCVGNAKQGQTFVEKMGKPATVQTLIIAKTMMHTDNRQMRCQKGNVNRFGTVRNNKGKIAVSDDFLQSGDGRKLQPTNFAARKVEANNLVRSRAVSYLLTRCSGQIDSQHLEGRSPEQHGILPGNIQERPGIAVAEL